MGYLVGLALVSALFYFSFISPVRKILHARTWLETPCVILSSGVEEDATDSGLYKILITYQYEIAGCSYRSSRYNFSFWTSTSGYRGKKAVVDRLAHGEQTVCYVNPLDVYDSVIERGITWDIVGAAILSIIMLSGVVFLWAQGVTLS